MSFFENFFQNQHHFLTSPIGVIAFIIFYSLWVMFLLPSSWISMLGGLIYGSILGSILVFIAASIGAILTFLTGRFFLKEWIQNRLSSFSRLQQIEQSIANEGLKIVILTRLSPAFPFGLLNIAYALSTVKIRDFLIGLLAILPGTFLYCSLGSLAGEMTKFSEILSNKSDLTSLLFTIIGLIATILVVLIFIKNIRKSIEDLD